MKYNKLMKMQLQRQSGASLSDASIIANLTKVIEGGFINEDGAITLKYQHQRKGNITLENSYDMTGYEYAVNKINLDILDIPRDIQLLGALFFAKLLVSALQIEALIVDGVNIVISLDGSNASISFYSVRPGEAILSDDLEKYTENAVLLIETFSEIETLVPSVFLV